MSMGLFALLDDVAVIAKMAAASLDDVAAQATKAGTKAAAVVIDDAAVTPSYVVGFSAQRELPMVWSIAKASLINKLVFLMPAVMALGYFLPAAITPILMLGGLYLVYEGAEKIFESFFVHKEEKTETLAQSGSSEDRERSTVKGAIRTDLILSAEIMAISLATVADLPLVRQLVVLTVIAIVLTFLVYGVVALIVKMDDVGLALSRYRLSSKALTRVAQGFGRSLVLAMPIVLKILTVVGTIAMTWVGGSIISHGLHTLGLHAPEELIQAAGKTLAMGVDNAFVNWLTTTLMQSVFGVMIGFALIPIIHFVVEPVIKKISSRKV